MIKTGELDLPEEFSLPQKPVRESIAEPLESHLETAGPQEQKYGNISEPIPEKNAGQYFEDLEKKFDDISIEISKEVTGDKVKNNDREGIAEDTEEPLIAGDSGLIEEWEQEDERLVDED
jgi:hypothetical protein